MLFAGILAASSVFITSCSKDDTEAPVITLSGDNPLELAIFESYVEPGYSASDNEDGDLTSSVSVDNSALAISFPAEITYSVSDAAGNSASESRTVESETRTYNVIDSCGSGAALIVFNYPQTVRMTNESTIGFNKFGNYSNNDGIVATFNSAGTITLASQLAQDIGGATEDHRFQGSGFVTSNGFVITYTDENTSAVPVSTTTCKATFIE